MYKTLEDLFYQLVQKCAMCKADLSNITSESYDHDDGVAVEGYTCNQWAYKTCPHCGYQTSYRKMELTKEEQINQLYREMNYHMKEIARHTALIEIIDNKIKALK
jgi:hypothetical protein